MTIYDLVKGRKKFFNTIDKHMFYMLYLKVNIAIITCKKQTDYISNSERWRSETPAGVDCCAIGFFIGHKKQNSRPNGIPPSRGSVPRPRKSERTNGGQHRGEIPG